ncbi:MAG: hypothetical protein ACRD26_05415 [Vicinamibacterales bacterium]
MKDDTFRPPGQEAIEARAAEQAGHASEADCFADEVVIDFPSVAPAVEKMRRTFDESDCSLPLCARIHLSPRQASEGVTLPLEVPVRSTCRTCGGRGETWSEPCARCGTTGTEVLTHQVHVSVPARVAHGARFRFSVAARHDPPTRVELHVAVR